MIVKLLTEHHLEFLSLKKAAEARPSLHMSKYHIVGNLIQWLIIVAIHFPAKCSDIAVNVLSSYLSKLA